MSLSHRHGGTITAISAIGHETINGVASWFFIGNVFWQDGTTSIETQIPPQCLCFDEDDEQGRRLFNQLSDYLMRQGAWHDPKRKRGRVYNWTPRAKTARESLQQVA